LAKYRLNYFITKLVKYQPLFKHFSNKNNLAGIWPIPASGTALHEISFFEKVCFCAFLRPEQDTTE
jgi:hypothetical protein